jgi:hypothetical protein
MKRTKINGSSKNVKTIYNKQKHTHTHINLKI